MLANAVYILSEDRFLHRVGWLHPPQQGFGNTSERPVKAAVINFINQTRRFARGTQKFSLVFGVPPLTRGWAMWTQRSLILVNIVFMVLCMLIG